MLLRATRSYIPLHFVNTRSPARRSNGGQTKEIPYANTPAPLVIPLPGARARGARRACPVRARAGLLASAARPDAGPHRAVSRRAAVADPDGLDLPARGGQGGALVGSAP